MSFGKGEAWGDPMLHISKCRESGRCMCISPFSSFFCCDLAPKVWCRCKGDTAGDWEYQRKIISFEFVTHWPRKRPAWLDRSEWFIGSSSCPCCVPCRNPTRFWCDFRAGKNSVSIPKWCSLFLFPASPLLGTFLQKYRWGAEYTRLMDVGMLPRRASGSHVSSCVESSSGQVTQQSLILVYILVMISKQIL